MALGGGGRGRAQVETRGGDAGARGGSCSRVVEAAGVRGETRLQDTTATEDEGSAGGLAVTEVAVDGGMKGAAAADETVGGALGAMLAFFLAETESMYCFMLFAVGASLANDLASFLQEKHVLRRDMVPFLMFTLRLWS